MVRLTGLGVVVVVVRLAGLGVAAGVAGVDRLAGLPLKVHRFVLLVLLV